MQGGLFNNILNNDSTVCDSITVELHNELSPHTVVSSSTILLHKNGLAEVILPPAFLNHNYFIAIRHRNSIETWSKFPVSIAANTNFDFTAP